MTDSRKAEPAIQAYSSEKDFSRQGSPFCVRWGAWKNMKNYTTAALRVEPFHILKTNEYCTPILEIAPLKTIQPDSVRGNATHPSAPPTPSLPGQGQDRPTALFPRLGRRG
jgi:hypothetical protein